MILSPGPSIGTEELLRGYLVYAAKRGDFTVSVSSNGLLVEKVYLDIRNRILSGGYPPGVRLIETELSKEFEVSRITIRESLRKLVVDDLVDLIPNSGIRVRKLSYQDIVDLYAVREPLEGLAARLAAQRSADKLSELNKLKEMCAEGAVATAGRDRFSHRFLNNNFHLAIVAITENRTLSRVLERLNLQMVASQFINFMQGTDLDESQRAHEEMLEAIQAGDGDKAELIMRLHVKQGREFALSCVPKI